MPAAFTACANISRSALNTAATSSLLKPPGTMPSLTSWRETAGALAQAGDSRGFGQGGGVAGDPLDDRIRGAGWHHETVPGREPQAGQSLRDRRQVGGGGNALRGADGDQPDPVAVGMRQQLRGIAEVKVH